MLWLATASLSASNEIQSTTHALNRTGLESDKLCAFLLNRLSIISSYWPSLRINAQA